MSAEDKAPPDVTAQEKWIVSNHVEAIRISYTMTSSDTSANYIHLKSHTGEEVKWLDSTFRKVARLDLSHNSLVAPQHGVVDRVKARLEYERKHAAELATYRRLKAKFESA